MSNYDDAIKDFQEVLKLNPLNSAAKQSIQTCREQIKVYQQKEKQLYANIFAKMAKQNEKVCSLILKRNFLLFFFYFSRLKLNLQTVKRKRMKKIIMNK
jgi:tetratricopeptide (TPR) repeat protein